MDTTTRTPEQPLAPPEPQADRNTRVPIWLQVTAAAVARTFDRVLLFVRDTWLIAVVVLVTLAMLGALLWLVWLIATAIVSALTDLAGAAGHGAAWLFHWLTGGPITHTISDPVRAFLDAHTAGLPATGRDLWITWLVTTVVLFLTALGGSTYPRIGWAGLGALTAAAAYFGAPTGSGPAAGGVIVAVWLLLSLPVYGGTKRASLRDRIALDLAGRRTKQATTKQAPIPDRRVRPRRRVKGSDPQRVRALLRAPCSLGPQKRPFLQP